MSIPPTERDPQGALPPTERDPALAAVRKRRRWPWVLAFLLAALAGTGLYFYRTLLRPPSTVHRHVPAGTSIALYADALKIALWKPVREHLWPLVLDSQGEEPADSSRARRIQEKTGVRVPADFREVIVASVDGTSWVAIVGGAIEPGRFVPGLAEVLQEDGVKGWRLEDDLLVHAMGFAIAQADDGTLLFGTTVNLVQAALGASEEEPPEGTVLPALPLSNALGFLVTSRAYRGAVGMLPLTIPGLDALSEIDQLHGTMTLDDAPQLSIVAEPKEGVDAATLGSKLDTALSRASLAMLLVSSDLYGAKEAISNAEVRSERGQVLIDARWPYEALDRAIGDLAQAIRAGR
jgi:hypothetical protein